MVGWIVADAETYTIGETATLTATSEDDLNDHVVWQTKVGDDEWTTAGYGNILKVDLTEENVNNIYRFKMEDGSFSEEIQLIVALVQAEETVEEETVEEEVAEEEVTEEETVEEEVAEEEVTEEETVEEEVAEEEITEEEVTEEEAVEEMVAEEEAIEEETEEDTEEQTEVSIEYADHEIEYRLTWDEVSPDIGSTAHLKAIVPEGEEEYLLQWQNSVDGVSFTDIDGATGDSFDVVVTMDNYKLYWRVVVRVPVTQETED